MRRSIIAFLAPLLLLACGDPDSPTVTRLSTNAAKYTLTTTAYGYEARIALSYSNANTFEVPIHSCTGGWSGWLERRRPTDGVWVYAVFFGDVMKCGGEIVVPAGATVRQVIDVRGCSSTSNCPDPSQFLLAGEYRALLGVTRDLPPEQITSNTFMLSTSSP
jgi:hypothetical protein